MIMWDIDYFTTKDLIKENDCSCVESIKFIRTNYGRKNIDAIKLYNDILESKQIPERWKKDAILYRTEYNSLKAYVDMYKRSEIINTGLYRVMFSGENIISGSLNVCETKVDELAQIEFDSIQNPIDIVGFKESKRNKDTVYTYIKYQNHSLIPDNIKLRITSFDGSDCIIVNNKNDLEEGCNNMKSLILDRIKKRYNIQVRYTDETDWYDCWVGI